MNSRVCADSGCAEFTVLVSLTSPSLKEKLEFHKLMYAHAREHLSNISILFAELRDNQPRNQSVCRSFNVSSAV